MADLGLGSGGITDGTTAELTDRLYVLRDPTGTPVDRWITPGYLKTLLAAASFAWSVNSALSAPAAHYSGTWITGGTATTNKPHFLIEPTGTTSTGWSTAGTGLGINAATGFTGNLLDLKTNGTSRFFVTGAGVTQALGISYGAFPTSDAAYEVYFTAANAKARTVSSRSASLGQDFVGLRIAANWVIGWASNNAGSGDITTLDISLARDAANTLALRNLTNAQTFNIYNTFTNSSNYEAGTITWSSNTFAITPTAAGTGTSRNFQLGGTACALIDFRTAGTQRWQINSSGHILAATDNTYDIGASGATRPRAIYAAGLIACVGFNAGGGNMVTSGTGLIGVIGGAFWKSTATNIFTLIDSPQTGFGVLEIGERTAPSAPATNAVRIYAEDNGSGKTRIMALFATGAAQQIAIEP